MPWTDDELLKIYSEAHDFKYSDAGNDVLAGYAGLRAVYEAAIQDAIPDGFMLVEKKKLTITLLESYTMLMRGLGTQLQLLSEIEALKEFQAGIEKEKVDEQD